MAVIALTIYIAFGVLALGGRLLMQRKRTGSTGYRGISRRLGIVGLAGGISFIVAMVGGLVAPLLQLLRVVAPLRYPQSRVGQRCRDSAGRVWTRRHDLCAA